MQPGQQPWSPPEATRSINGIARNKLCDLSYTFHAKERVEERGLLVSDVLFVLRNGHVYDAAEPSTLAGHYKYRIEGQSPNSGSRTVRVVVVPDTSSCQIKVVTVMWRDET